MRRRGRQKLGQEMVQLTAQRTPLAVDAFCFCLDAVYLANGLRRDDEARERAQRAP